MPRQEEGTKTYMLTLYIYLYSATALTRADNNNYWCTVFNYPNTLNISKTQTFYKVTRMVCFKLDDHGTALKGCKHN